jgi:hypothetical protein
LLTTKNLITKRKFYGKWLYKVTLKLPGIAMLRLENLDRVEKFLTTIQTPDTLKYSWHKKAYDNKDDIIAVCKFLKKVDKDTWAKRIETNNMDIYTNDTKIYNSLNKKFNHILTVSSSPDTSRVSDYDNQHHIICNKLPHDRYKYKIYLKPHKFNKDRQAKKQYLDWLDTQKNVLISQAVKNWFIATDWNWDRRYILVEDSNTLLMLQMKNAEILGKVYEFIINK